MQLERLADVGGEICNAASNALILVIKHGLCFVYVLQLLSFF